MWPSRDHERRKITTTLKRYDANLRHLPGLSDARAVEVLALQFIASLRREDYYKVVQLKPVTTRRADPNDPSFDAERAVAYHLQVGDVDEAAWLIFLMTHFARPADTGWLRLRDVYGRRGKGVWDWETVSADPTEFVSWLAANWRDIRGKFGNHRKYESLRPDADRNMGRVVSDYLAWIGPNGHERFFADVVRHAGNDPQIIFNVLYKNLRVLSFGRLAKFDYLALIGRYGIAPISPGSAYLSGATGPLAGARLLFDGRRDGQSSEATLQCLLDTLDAELKVGMGVIEDALCNWQKSPLVFEYYRG